MKFTCGDLLFTPLREVIIGAIASCDKYEVDPSKVPEGVDPEENANNLIQLAEGFLEVIFSTEIPMSVLLVSLVIILLILYT